VNEGTGVRCSSTYLRHALKSSKNGHLLAQFNPEFSIVAKKKVLDISRLRRRTLSGRHYFVVNLHTARVLVLVRTKSTFRLLLDLHQICVTTSRCRSSYAFESILSSVQREGRECFLQPASSILFRLASAFSSRTLWLFREECEMKEKLTLKTMDGC
jgi:hypothetical protein